MKATIENPGSPQNQITLFTHRINHLTMHLKKHKKDYSSKKSLLDLVSKRSRMLKYLQRKNVLGYRELCGQLSIRHK